MKTSFAITPVEKGIVRCQDTGEFTPEDYQSLEAFMLDYRGKLLIDLSSNPVEECSRNIQDLRTKMPTTAIFGAPIDPKILEVPKSYYYSTHDVRFFITEAEAIEWLRKQ
jgi:hypothetical protein